MDYAPNWPPPPFLTYRLFESPLLLCVLLLTVAAVLGLIGFRRAQRRPMIAGGFVAALAVALFITAHFVTTDRERMAQRTRELVRAAVVPVNLDAFREILGREAMLGDRDYDQIIATLERSTHTWKVRDAFITRLVPHQDDETRGQTYLCVVTRLDTSLGGGSSQTRWLLHWLKEPDGAWRITRIEWLSLNDRDARDSDLP